MECTQYETCYVYEDDPLCRCPICKGFLPRSFPINKPFKCNKCGTELMTFPEIDEETKEELEYGKICPISINKD